MIKEPMLAATLKPDMIENLEYPAIVSPKVDGIRAFSSHGETYSRKLKLIPNAFVQASLASSRLHGIDGELIVGKPSAEDVYRVTMSGVMSRDGEPDFKLWTFDDYTIGDMPFKARIAAVESKIRDLQNAGYPVRLMPHQLVNNASELLAFEDRCLAKGLEGIIVRSTGGLYKQGRSTARQGWLFKYKRFTDAEAQILAVNELMHNDNPAETNELGRTKRSGHKENKRGGGTLGSITCKTPEGVVFNIGGGPGLTADYRAYLWSIREKLPGQFVKYSSLQVGVKEAPRHPKLKEIYGFQFLGLRHPIDMDPNAFEETEQ